VQAATKVVGQPLFDELASRHGWPRGSALRASNPLDWGQIPTRGGGGKPFRIESHEQAIAWVDTYDAAVARVDAEIRRLFEFAESLEPTLPALWIVTSDHGEGLGGHGYYGHGRHVYAEQLQVPLIVFASDSSLPARTIEALVSLVDLAPSVADLLGNPGPSADPAIEGASFASLVRADDGRWIDRPAFAERRPLDDLRRALGRTHEEIDAIQSGSYKYIRVEGGRDEFYDLATDALELHNIVDQPHPARDELRSLLEVKLTWLNEHAGRAEPIADQHVEELRALGYIQ
jgi:arylsulfatase A-like enzyme